MLINDEIQTLKLLRSGDERAFKLLFDTYFVPLCRFMKLYLKDETLIEEIALDIFMYIWTNRENFTIRLTIKAYLFQAARNRCLNVLRDNKQTCPVDEFCETLSDSHTIDADMEAKELNRLVEEAVCSLPDKCREVFRQSRQENLTNKEIAEKTQTSVKTVEAQITKALKHIRKYLDKSYSYLF
ncbi:RNA polymerase sigma-70 factor [Bacteroides helcogenes]|uniref:RNA polymerase, sigma-24 subunit, ECF subfamily n=1 Tax=Bacteroides helcogenes (strain ATCC 35417 / DSM 20613 / JCM 6297 / CCUG 15421 / P 36-108) TaxID=693979 RepID=E6SNZ3_BACT6|nr:RNA polymerase sigma-70 factor [Bacteroides helcogenes]ADV42811.1 RNA polymerase, sigma-24 subunit, ECF subfamily [Bacteroides helcogenes P 36-108]MDY5239641.1 RNA polymerase sigma-70 factor [Bacteroides helcogenes]